MRTFIAAALAAALAVAAAHAAPPERLVMRPYPGGPWKQITDKSNEHGWIHEQIPAAQSVAGFTDILTDQGYAAGRGDDPRTFFQARFANIQGACVGMRVNGPVLNMEGGHKVGYAQVYCGRQAGEAFGVHIFYKVISGDSALYAVSREFHVPASEVGGVMSFPKGHERDAAAMLGAEKQANDYLAKDVYLCGGRSDDLRCGK
jgi:hypothetical protein